MGRMKSMGYDYALHLSDWDEYYYTDASEIFEQIVNGSIQVPSWFVTKWVEENPVFAAETNAWKQQKRDTKGRFTTGFVAKTDAQLEVDYQEKIEFDESYGEHLEEQALYEDVIAPFYQYVDMDVDLEIGPDEITDFMETAIGDDEFPEKLTEPAFFQFLQKIAESVPLEILEGLNSIMNMQQQLGDKMGDRDTEITGGRGVFITDILMNIKTGQEAWAAEDGETQSFEAYISRSGHVRPSMPTRRRRLGKTSCCCGATAENPCLCMINGIMECSSTEPMCPCYQKLAGAEGTWHISNDAESFASDTLVDCEEREDGWMRAVAELEDYLEWFVANSSKSKIKEFNKYRFDPNYTFDAEDDKKPVGTPMQLGKPLDWMPYDEKITAFSRKRAENDDDTDNREVNLMRFELVEAEMDAVDFNYLYDLLLHGTPGWANISDEEVIEEYRQRFER